MRILIKAPLNSFTGYGNDGIGLTMALLEAGVDVYLDPTTLSPPIPAEIATLLTKPLSTDKGPFDLLIHHVDPSQLGITQATRRAAKTTVAWSMWEYGSLDNCKRRSSLRKRMADYDLFLGYDSVTAAAFAPYVTGRAGVLQGGFWPENWRYVDRVWNGPKGPDGTGDRFGFCMVGQLHQRKDPFVAIEAFRELKEEYPEEFEPAELHLKTTVRTIHPGLEQIIPKLRVHYATWSQDVLRAFYGTQHCMLAPSRGEGKNMPPLEFMATGGTVIATNWGGHTQWLTPAVGYPLDYTLVPDAPTTPKCVSARASKDHLKSLMLHVLRNRAEAGRKGRTASELIPQMCSWPAVVDRLFTRLGDLPDGKMLQHSYRRARDYSNPHPAQALV